MKKRMLGNSGIEISVVGMGTWAIGGGVWWGDTDEKEAVLSIQTALDYGVNLVDTAPAYGFGYSEEIVGKAIKGRRDQVVLSTKCGLWWGENPNSMAVPAFEQEGRKVYKDLRPQIIRKELELSLTRLKTDYIDIYHTHWQDVLTPISQTAACLADLKKEGKIRSIAVSNASITDCEAYLRVCDISANQVKYSLLDCAIEGELIPYSLKNNIGILAYSPLEQGLLTGCVTMETIFPQEQHRNSIPWYAPQNRKKVLEMLDQFIPLTQKYNCTLAQLIIAWTIEQQGIISVLCGARKSHSAMENAIAGSLTIDTKDLEFIRKAANQLGHV